MNKKQQVNWFTVRNSVTTQINQSITCLALHALTAELFVKYYC